MVLYREAYTQQLRLGAYYVDSKLKVRKHRRIKGATLRNAVNSSFL